MESKVFNDEKATTVNMLEFFSVARFTTLKNEHLQGHSVVIVSNPYLTWCLDISRQLSNIAV